MIRALLTAATIGTLTGVALTFGPHGAIGIAVCAAGVIAWYLVRAVRRDSRYTTQDPSVWRQTVYLATPPDYFGDVGYHVYSDGER